MSQENQGFTVSDKRIKLDTPVEEKKSASAEIPPAGPESRKDSVHHSEVDFSGFLLSLGTSALVHLGDAVLPGQKTQETNLPQAKEIIDLLSVLEAKTKGNLSQDESSLLSNLLYTLRMKFVELKNK